MTALPGTTTPTAHAEASTGLLYRTLGAHRTAALSLAPRSPSTRLATAPDERHQIQCQATLLRLLSITESFAAETLLRHAEQAVDPSAHLITEKIWDRAATTAVSAWQEQEKHYTAWLGVRDVDWQPMHRLAHARNAIAHGLGTLTRLQRRKHQSVHAALRTAAIPTDGDRIRLDDNAVSHAAATCRTFINSLDAAVQQRHPAARP